ncbi:MAG TPA: hypothetical protein VED66_13260 [Candidatus Sulfotelmatobacter sp.]|nr:hypothetical protein [Candidatus Sulfotelmatobacter sp.]
MKDLCRTYGAQRLDLLVFPALTRWANIFRASGAAKSRPKVGR